MNKLKIDNTDTNREWLTSQKLVHFFNVMFNKKATEVLEYVERFCYIDFEKHLIEWKKWIILDVDDCIAPHHGEILGINESIIKNLKLYWWKIVIHSNMKKSDRYEGFKKLDIEVITSKYAKPDERGFEECLESMWLKANEVMMIWDNFLTDGWSIWAGIDFIKVKPIETEEKNPSVWRVVQKVMRSFVDEVARVRGNI